MNLPSFRRSAAVQATAGAIVRSARILQNASVVPRLLPPQPPGSARCTRVSKRDAFTLMEVVIASAIFFLAVFAILALVSSTLRNARSLRHIQVDAGMIAAQLFKTNKFSEQVESGDFGSAYPDYSWQTESMEAQTNGLWQFNITVMRRGQHEPVDQISLFIFSPESSSGPFGPRR
jgi:hypothetical protein